MPNLVREETVEVGVSEAFPEVPGWRVDRRVRWVSYTRTFRRVPGELYPCIEANIHNWRGVSRWRFCLSYAEEVLQNVRWRRLFLGAPTYTLAAALRYPELLKLEAAVALGWWPSLENPTLPGQVVG